MAGNSSSTSQNQSTNSSSSQSSTQVLDYPERAFLDAIAQYAGTVGQNVYNWAQGEYAKNSSLTDANIHNYLNTSAQSLGMANNDLNRYEQKFQPEENQLLADANSYASDNRKLFEMGAAESGQAQASEAARKNAERNLQSYGIDVSSGRYYDLDLAARVSAGAAEAGAAQMARQNVEQTGRDLRSQAIAVGSQYPGRIVNSMNTALQGFAGAENAGLANANTGVALQGAANPFLNTASSYKPITGTQSSSQSAGQSTGSSVSQSVSTDPPQNPSSNDKQQQQQQPQQQSGGGSSSPGTGSGFYTGSGGSSPSGGGSGGGSGSGSGGYGDYSNGSGGLPDGGYNSGGYGGDPYTGGPDSAGYNGGGYGGDPYTSGGYPDAGQAAYDAIGGGGDIGGAYAQGGAIPEDDTGGIPQDGGAIPQSASPSGGQMVDDVRAQSPHGAINVNADEFVIPRDVALWKGQEFFQQLIAKSRQARITAPAHPTRGAPAQNMR